MHRSRLPGLMAVVLLSASIVQPSDASAQAQAGPAASSQSASPAPRVQSVRRFGGSTRFVAPVRTVDALKRSMSRPTIRRDIGRVLDGVGMVGLQNEMTRILSEGQVTEATLPNGTAIEWMALRRSGRPGVIRNARWDGPPARGYEFVIDNMSETYTFFVPDVCGNISLLRREPSRAAARQAEEARMAADTARRVDEARVAEARRADDERAAAAAASAAEAARVAEEARKAEEARVAAAARQAEAGGLAPEARKAEEARVAETPRADSERAAPPAAAARGSEAARVAEEARKAEAARVPPEARGAEDRQAEVARLGEDEAREARLRPFVAGMFGKQHRQYDDTDPAEFGQLTNPVIAFGDAILGVKGGVAVRMGERWSFLPALGFARNLERGERSSLFGDAEVAYTFPIGASLGSGVTLWDMTHREIFTLGWLGTGSIPIWRSDSRKHDLFLSAEWRQFFDRGSDPDVNYQFWAGAKYVFK